MLSSSGKLALAPLLNVAPPPPAVSAPLIAPPHTPVSAPLKSGCPPRPMASTLVSVPSSPSLSLSFLSPLSAPLQSWNFEFMVMFYPVGQIAKPLDVSLSVGELGSGVEYMSSCP